MKNKVVPLIALLVSGALLASCTVNGNSNSGSVTNNSSDNNTTSNNNNYEDNSNPDDLSSKDITSSFNSSSGQTSSSSQSGSSSQNNTSSQDNPELDTLDEIIAKFLNGINVTVPSLEQYDLSFSVIYYYAYQQYYIVAAGADRGGTIDSQYAKGFTADTGLVSQNDDSWYTVEDVGYIFADADDKVNVTFYTEDGFFQFSITRNDGLTGTLDVSDVDTNWYVDYVNLQGCDLFNNFPASDIKECLELDNNLVIPSVTSNGYASYFQDEYEDEDGAYPRTYVLVVEGDQITNYINILKGAGYTAEIHQETTQEIDWDTFDVIDVTYDVGTAVDANKNVYMSMSLDEYENTIVQFYNFADIFTSSKTTNTDWTDEEKTLMNSVLNYVVPFMQFGDNYYMDQETESGYTYVYLEDSYYEDLSQDYINLLLSLGYKEDSVSYDSTCYYYDNGLNYIEIFVGYEMGNYFVAYSEDSHLAPLTSLTLNQTAVDIVAGASFQLEAIQTPSNANHPITWSTSNSDIATVSNNGLVTISNTANTEDTVTITASSPSGKTASCTFTVKPNSVTGIRFTQDNYSVIPGAPAIQVEYELLPIGATSTRTPSYTYSPLDVGVHLDGYGKLSADADAVPSTTVELIMYFGTICEARATATVAAPTITHTLTREFFGIEKANYSKYLTYTKTTDDGATYEACAAGNNGIQLRSKSSDSGIVGHMDGRTCKSITFTFDSNTYSTRVVDIYASNSPFTIADMYGNSLTKVGSISYNQSDASTTTQTYTFTDNYSYIGFRSNDGAIYLTSVEVVW